MTVELVLLLIFIVFILSGYRKGLILSLCGLIILVLSCLGASAAQQRLTPRIVNELHPRLVEVISEALEERVAQTAEYAITDASDAGITIAGQPVSTGDLIDLLGSLGMDVQQAESGLTESVAAPVVASVSEAIASMLLESFAGFGVFCVAFLIIFLVLRTIELGVNTVDRLPVVHTLNHLCGGLIGFISGAFFLVTAMAAITGSGLVSPEIFTGPISGLLRSIVEELLLLLTG